jgi:hypothetical protein
MAKCIFCDGKMIRKTITEKDAEGRPFDLNVNECTECGEILFSFKDWNEASEKAGFEVKLRFEE